MWPAYRAWYLQEGGAERPGPRRPAGARSSATCRSSCRSYERLVELAGGDELAARLLSLYRPPGFVVGCSQGAWTRDGGPVLVRNYDYPVDAAGGDRLPDASGASAG